VFAKQLLKKGKEERSRTKRIKYEEKTIQRAWIIICIFCQIKINLIIFAKNRLDFELTNYIFV